MLSKSETESKQKIRRNKVRFHCLFAFRWIPNTKTLNTQFKIWNTQLSQKEVGKYPIASNPYLELWVYSETSAEFNGEQEKTINYLCGDGIENLSLGITVCNHSASLVMVNGDSPDGFFYPILMTDSYCILGINPN